MTRIAELPQSRTSVDTLEVRLGSTLIGTIAHLNYENTVFVFDPDYVNDSDRPTLSLGFKDQTGGLIDTIRATRVRLPPFFSNLLPEGHLRNYLAERGQVHPDREFFLLRLLGADLPGAVEVVPGSSGVTPSGRGDDKQHHDADDDDSQRRSLRFSLAGVQLKFSAVAESGGGLTIPVGGVGGNWIAKLPSTRFSAVPENEYAMMTFASKIGIGVPEIRLLPTTEIANLPALPEAFGKAFVIRRFDRTATGRRIHIEDFAQVFGVYAARKYETANYSNLARVVWLETGEAGLAEFIRRLVFNVFIGNGDAHLKNWSLIYPDGRSPQLAPAYDLVGTVAYISGDRLALTLGDTKEFAEVDLNQFTRLAEKAELPTRFVLKTVRDTAQAIRDYWATHEPIRELPSAIRTPIETHMKALSL